VAVSVLHFGLILHERFVISLATMKLSIPTVLVLAISQYAEPKNISVYGWATESCSSWTDAERSSVNHPAQSQWVAGFLSGLNLGSTDEIEQTDIPGAVAWINNYCADHPSDKVMSAAEALTVQLRGKGQ